MRSYICEADISVTNASVCLIEDVDQQVDIPQKFFREILGRRIRDVSMLFPHAAGYSFELGEIESELRLTRVRPVERLEGSVLGCETWQHKKHQENPSIEATHVSQPLNTAVEREGPCYAINPLGQIGLA
jgi:hypothetical protein